MTDVLYWENKYKELFPDEDDEAKKEADYWEGIYRSLSEDAVEPVSPPTGPGVAPAAALEVPRPDIPPAAPSAPLDLVIEPSEERVPYVTDRAQVTNANPSIPPVVPIPRKPLYDEITSPDRELVPAKLPPGQQLAIPETSRQLPDVDQGRPTEVEMPAAGSFPQNKEPTKDIAIVRAIQRGLQEQSPEVNADALEAFSHMSPGDGKTLRGWSETVRSWGGKNPRLARQGPLGATDLDLTTLKGLDDALTYVGEQVGEALASSVPAAVLAAPVAVAGGLAFGPVGARAGGKLGAAIPMYMMNTGDLYGALKEAGAKPEQAAKWATAGAIPISTMDMVALGKIFSGANRAIRKKTFKVIAQEIIKFGGIGVISEGGTEVIQEELQFKIVEELTGHKPTDKEHKDALLGALIGGGGMGAIGGGGARAGGSVFAQEGKNVAEIEKAGRAYAELIKLGENPFVAADVALGRMTIDRIRPELLNPRNKINTKMPTQAGFPDETPLPADPLDTKQPDVQLPFDLHPAINDFEDETTNRVLSALAGTPAPVEKTVKRNPYTGEMTFGGPEATPEPAPEDVTPGDAEVLPETEATPEPVAAVEPAPEPVVTPEAPETPLQPATEAELGSLKAELLAGGFSPERTEQMIGYAREKREVYDKLRNKVDSYKPAPKKVAADELIEAVAPAGPGVAPAAAEGTADAPVEAITTPTEGEATPETEGETPSAPSALPNVAPKKRVKLPSKINVKKVIKEMGGLDRRAVERIGRDLPKETGKARAKQARDLKALTGGTTDVETMLADAMARPELAAVLRAAGITTHDDLVNAIRTGAWTVSHPTSPEAAAAVGQEEGVLDRGEFERRVRDVTSAVDILDVQESIQESLQAGDISQEDAQSLRQTVRARMAELAGEPVVEPASREALDDEEPLPFDNKAPYQTTEPFGGFPNSFELTGTNGEKASGYTANADFPGEGPSPTRGEIFYVEVPEGQQRKGLGLAVTKEALAKMSAAGATTVNTHPVTEAGRNLNAKLIAEGLISAPIRTSPSGKTEHTILSVEGVADNKAPYGPEPKLAEVRSELDAINARRKAGESSDVSSDRFVELADEEARLMRVQEDIKAQDKANALARPRDGVSESNPPYGTSNRTVKVGGLWFSPADIEAGKHIEARKEMGAPDLTEDELADIDQQMGVDKPAIETSTEPTETDGFTVPKESISDFSLKRLSARLLEAGYQPGVAAVPRLRELIEKAEGDSYTFRGDAEGIAREVLGDTGVAEEGAGYTGETSPKETDPAAIAASYRKRIAAATTDEEVDALLVSAAAELQDAPAGAVLLTRLDKVQRSDQVSEPAAPYEPTGESGELDPLQQKMKDLYPEGKPQGDLPYSPGFLLTDGTITTWGAEHYEMLKKAGITGDTPMEDFLNTGAIRIAKDPVRPGYVGFEALKPPTPMLINKMAGLIEQGQRIELEYEGGFKGFDTVGEFRRFWRDDVGVEGVNEPAARYGLPSTAESQADRAAARRLDRLTRIKNPTPEQIVEMRNLEARRSEGVKEDGAEYEPSGNSRQLLYRGVRSDGSEGPSNLGKGRYSTPYKEKASAYGVAEQVSLDEFMPNNPLVLNGTGPAEGLLKDYIFRNTEYRNIREFNKDYPDVGVWVREQGFDGVIASDEVVRYPDDAGVKEDGAEYEGLHPLEQKLLDVTGGSVSRILDDNGFILTDGRVVRAADGTHAHYARLATGDHSRGDEPLDDVLEAGVVRAVVRGDEAYFQAVRQPTPAQIATMASTAKGLPAIGVDVDGDFSKFTTIGEMQRFFRDQGGVSEAAAEFNLDDALAEIDALFNPVKLAEETQALTVVGKTKKTSSGIRVLYKAIDEDLRTHGYIDMTEKSVKTAHEVAIVAQIWRNPFFESLRLIYTDANGKIVATEAFTSKETGFSGTGFHAGQKKGKPEFKVLEKNIKELHKRIGRLESQHGPLKVWLSHNHPSGDPIASDEDVKFNAKFNELFNDMRTGNNAITSQFAGHVIIDTNQFTVLEANIYAKGARRDLGSGEITNFMPEAPPEVNTTGLRTIVNGIDVAQVASQFKSPDRFMTVIYRGGGEKGWVMGVEEIPIGAVMADDFAGYIKNRRRHFGASDAFVYYGGQAVSKEDFAAKMTPLVNQGSIVDAIHNGAERFSAFNDLRSKGIEPKKNVPRKTERVNEKSAPYGDQTQTPEFKAWFGKSEVVDENGAPLVVHHSGQFDETEDGIPDVSNGMHFGTKSAAEMRVSGKYVDDFILAGRVYKGENEDGETKWWWESGGMESYDVVDEDGFDSEEEAKASLDHSADDFKSEDVEEPPFTEAYLSIRNPMRAVDQKDDWTAAIKKAKSLGHDGIIYRNKYEDPGSTSYIAFDPTQIKSATGNSGAFSREDPSVIAEGKAPYQDSSGRTHPAEVSTRFPTAAQVANTELDPFNNLLKSDYEAVKGDPKWLAHTARVLYRYPNPTPKTGTPLVRVEGNIEHGKRNLIAAHNMVPEETRIKTMLWYDTANRVLSEVVAPDYSKSTEQITSMAAVLSPQNEWGNNIAQMFRVLDFMQNHQETRWSPEMQARGVSMFAESDNEEAKLAFRKLSTKNQRFSQLILPLERAVFLRIFDEITGTDVKKIITLDGDIVDHTEGNKFHWNSFSPIAKAIRIYEDGSVENIAKQLGEQHKVRNFHNNMLVPNSPNDHTTVDTHAAAIYLWRPLGSNALEIKNLFGGKLKGKKYLGPTNSKISGVQGTYPVYYESYARAAKELGLEYPRQLQSIVWEFARALFTDSNKKLVGFTRGSDAVWTRHSAGRITEDEARQQVYNMAVDQSLRLIEEKRINGGSDATAKEEIESLARSVGSSRIGPSAGVYGGRESSADETGVSGIGVRGQGLGGESDQRGGTGDGAADAAVAEEGAPYGEPAPTFYSAALKAAEGLKQAKGAPTQMYAMLKKVPGVKDDELDWMGLLPWMQGKKTVTKEEIAEFIRANEITIEEVEKGKLPPKWEVTGPDGWSATFSTEDEATAYVTTSSEEIAGDTLSDEADYSDEREEEIRQEIRGQFHISETDAHTSDDLPGRSIYDTKYADQVLPGAKEGTYRELLLTMPFSLSKEVGWTALHPNKATKQTFATKEEAETKAQEWGGRVVEASEREDTSRQAYTGGHYGAEHPNLLTHIRFNERIDADGKRTLFIEEIQSDWGQTGRTKGFQGEGENHLVFERDGEFYVGNQSTGSVSEGFVSRENAQALADSRNMESDPYDSRVPKMPMAKTWHELAMKRMLRYASANGYDSISWTTGEQQADRYDLSKQVRAIETHARTDAVTREQSRVVLIDTNEGDIINLGLGNDGVVDNSPNYTEYEGKSLSDVVGKEMADRIMSGPINTTYEGDGLRVGGAGMKGFYDDMLPRFLKKYGKRWGAVPGMTEIETGEDQPSDKWEVFNTASTEVLGTFDSQAEAIAFLKAQDNPNALDYDQTTRAPTTVHSMPITDAMKQSVMQEGQGVFEEKAPYSLTPQEDRRRRLQPEQNTTMDFGDQRTLPSNALKAEGLGLEGTPLKSSAEVAKAPQGDLFAPKAVEKKPWEYTRDEVMALVQPAADLGYFRSVAEGKWAIPGGGGMETTKEAAVTAYMRMAQDSKERAAASAVDAEVFALLRAGNYTDEDLGRLTRFGKPITAKQEVIGVLRSLGMRDVDAKNSLKAIRSAGFSSGGTELFHLGEAVESARKLGFLKPAAEAPQADLFGGVAEAGAEYGDERQIEAAKKAWQEKGVESPWFKRWAGDTAVPGIVYHQTSKEAEQKILTGNGFDLGMIGARRSDEGVPDGIFMKPSDNDIGLGAVEREDRAQMSLYASIRNPLRVRNRGDLIAEFIEDPEYRRLIDAVKQVDRDYMPRSDREEEALGSVPGDRKTPEHDAEWDRRFKIWSDTVNEWRTATDDAATEARSRLTELIRENGFDGVIIEEDEGSGGRVTTTFIALDPTQIKSTDNVGTFDAEDPSIVADQAAPYGDQTQTPEFKAWFGSSQAVDGRNQPLVLLHGMPDARFLDEDAVFKTSKERYGIEDAERAFFFTNDGRTAATYADDRRAFDYQNAEPGVAKVFLSLQNPLVINGGGVAWGKRGGPARQGEQIQAAKDAGHDGMIIRRTRDTYNDQDTAPLADVYVVFSSEQIKSATGNSGAFDATDPSIVREDSAPYGKDLPPLDTPEFEQWFSGVLNEFGIDEQRAMQDRPAEVAAEADVEAPVEAEAAATPAAAQEGPPPGMKQRRGAASLERAGLPGGSDQFYKVLSNRVVQDEVLVELKKLGIDRAAELIMEDKKPGAHRTVMAAAVIAGLQAQSESLRKQAETATGDASAVFLSEADAKLERTVAIATTLTQRLTEAGREGQAAAIWARMHEDSIIIWVQQNLDRVNKKMPTKSSKPPRKLTVEEVQKIRGAARNGRQWAEINSVANQMVDVIDKIFTGGQLTEEETGELQDLAQNLRGMIDPETVETPKPRKPRKTKKEASVPQSPLAIDAEDLQSMMAAPIPTIGRDRPASVQSVLGKKLATAESAARARLKARGIRLSAGLPLDDAIDWGIIGASTMHRTGAKFTNWSAAMVAEFGDLVEPHLRQIYGRARKTYGKENSTARKAAARAKYIFDLLEIVDPEVDGLDLRQDGEPIQETVAEKFQLTEQDALNVGKLVDELKTLSGDAQIEAAQEIQLFITAMEPVGVLRKISTHQRIGHLLNPVTWMRNIVGNELLWRADRISRRVSTPVDIGRSKLTGGDRYITFRTGHQGGYWAGFFYAVPLAWKGIAPGGLTTGMSLETTRGPAFRGKGMSQRAFEKITGLNSEREINIEAFFEKVLGVGLRSLDYAAYNRAYLSILGMHGELAADKAGIGGKHRTSNKAERAKRQAFIDHFVANADENLHTQAAEYGKYVTFQDDNILSLTAVEVKRALNLHQEFGAGDIFLKYPKTPSALVMRAIEYSPLGLARAAFIAADPYFRPVDVNPAEVEMAVSRAIVGTGFTAFGMLLYSMGALTLDPDKDRDTREFLRDQTGRGRGQINMSGIGRYAMSFDANDLKMRKGDMFSTYNWAQPLSTALSFGANIQKRIQDTADGSSVLEMVMEAAWGGLSTFGELPTLSGLSQALGGYPGEDKGLRNLQYVAEGIPQQAIPLSSLVNQVRKMMDNKVRETHDPTVLGRAINRVMARLPFLSERLPAVYKSMGIDNPREAYQNDSNNFFNVFINPGFINYYKVDPFVAELLKPYDESGETKQFPRSAPRKLKLSKTYLDNAGMGRSFDGPKTFPLTGADRQAYQRAMAAYFTRSMKNLDVPPSLSDERQMKLVTDALTDAQMEANTWFANNRAQAYFDNGSVLPGEEPENTGGNRAYARPTRPTRPTRAAR